VRIGVVGLEMKVYGLCTHQHLAQPASKHFMRDELYAGNLINPLNGIIRVAQLQRDSFCQGVICVVCIVREDLK
jgi:hypothetical protein